MERKRNTNHLILMDQIHKTYRLGEQKLHVLNHISLEIQHRDFLAVVGPSGSGKSTLMNIIGLLDDFNSGEYYLDGINVSTMKDSERAKIRNQKIGFVFQNFNLLAKLNAYENVELPLIYQGMSRKMRKSKVEKSLEQVGLSDRMHHKTAELSGGQQQRVAIARALVTDSPIILADEPTGALDTKTGEEIIQILHELNEQGKTIIVITHDETVAKECRRTIHMVDGMLTEEGVHA